MFLSVHMSQHMCSVIWFTSDDSDCNSNIYLNVTNALQKKYTYFGVHLLLSLIYEAKKLVANFLMVPHGNLTTVAVKPGHENYAARFVY